MFLFSQLTLSGVLVKENVLAFSMLKSDKQGKVLFFEGHLKPPGSIIICYQWKQTETQSALVTRPVRSSRMGERYLTSKFTVAWQESDNNIQCY